MKRKRVEAFVAEFGFDLSIMSKEDRATWYRAAAKKRRIGHTEEMPMPPYTLEEIERAERIIASMAIGRERGARTCQ